VGIDGNGLEYNGYSSVIDPQGDILYSMADQEDIFTIELSKTRLEETRNTFPFQQDRDEFIIL
jgi:predicted amidohydrolase